jgi:hypothetical protein
MTANPTKNAPRRNHFVPKFYLQFFAIPEQKNRKHKQVYVYQRGRNKPRINSVRKVAVIKDFYTVVDPDTNQKSYVLEKYLQRVEDKAALEIAAVLKEDRPVFDEERKKRLALFIGLLAVRTQQHFNWEVRFLDKAKEVSEAALKNEPEKFIGNFSPDEVIKKFGKDNILKVVQTEGFLNDALDDVSQTRLPRMLERGRKIAVLLMNKNWFLATRETSKFFITSDHPVVTLRHSGMTEGGFLQGYVLMPLSPNKCLIVFHGQVNSKLKGKDINAINQTVMFYADREVYSHSDVSGIQNQFNSSPHEKETEIEFNLD